MEMVKGINLKKYSRSYPSFCRNTIWVLGFLIFLVGTFVYGKVALTSAGLFPASDIPHLFRQMQIQCIVFAVAIVFLFFLTKVLKKFPWRLLLVLGGVAFLIIFTIVLLTSPNQSADPYWNMILIKGFAKYGLNPYFISPNSLVMDSWYKSVSAWQDISMTHGPLWVWFLSLPVYFTKTLGSAINVTRFMYLGIFISAIIIFWKIMEHYKCDDRKKTFLTLFLVLNPYVIQNVFVDLHNDVIIMFLSVQGLYLYTKGKYVASSIALFLTGLIKYLPTVLMIIPVIAIIEKKNISLKKKLLMVGLIGGICLAVSLVLFLPFIKQNLLLPGLVNEATNRWSALYAMPIPLILKRFGVSPLAIRLIGLAAMAVSVIYFSIKKKELLALSVPVVLFFFVGTPWFQPWYMLWIFPVLLLLLPFRWIAIISVGLVLSPWVVYPLPLSLILILLLISEYSIKVIRQTGWWARV